MDYLQAVNLVIATLQEELGNTEDEHKQRQILEATESTRLFGGDGLLDSMGVVILLSELEERLENEFDITIALSSDSAMSKTRSPFRSVKSIATHILASVELK